MMNKNHENQQVIVDQIKPPFIGVVTRTHKRKSILLNKDQATLYWCGY